MSVVLYCPVCGDPYDDGRVVCPMYGCGHPRLVTLEDAIAANRALGRLLTPDPDRETA